jgi:AcrR family transcriptional regulator|tara:strand:+ start:18184 stop:18900 length:717 start_codon:yes stop_codon:yes gene_type:complete
VSTVLNTDSSESSSNWKRARRPEQIDARRGAILSATRRLIDHGGISSAGLTSIAQEAGSSKANLYRYFESREAILLELFEIEVAVWSKEFAGLLQGLPVGAAVSEVAQALSDSLNDRKIYNSLFGVLASEIEPRLSEELLIRSRAALREAFVGLLVQLRRVLPHLSKSQLNEFLTMHAMFQAGVWPHASPGANLSRLMEREEFSGMKMDFGERVRWHALILLLGLESVSQPRIRPVSD